MDFQGVAAIFKLVAYLNGFGGQLSRLANGNESRIQAVGERWTKDESASLHAEDEIYIFADVVFREGVDKAREAEFVFEKRRDVVEEDAFLWKVGDLADQLLQPVTINRVGRQFGRRRVRHRKLTSSNLK